jgi:hypothetical protein
MSSYFPAAIVWRPLQPQWKDVCTRSVSACLSGSHLNLPAGYSYHFQAIVRLLLELEEVFVPQGVCGYVFVVHCHFENGFILVSPAC